MLGAGLAENNTQNLEKWVLNPGHLKEGTRMEDLAAAYQGAPMTKDEVSALVAYLQGRTTDPKAQPAPTATASTAQPTPTGQVPSGNVGLEIRTVGSSLTFNTSSFAVKAGSDVTMKLVNGAPTPNLEHNWVLVKGGTESAVESAGLAAGPSKGWIQTGDPNVIANTPLVKGGATGSVSFKAPAAGSYGFICSFPGHAGTMHGTFTVVP
jgi:azurin